MKVIIAGSRGIFDYQRILDAVTESEFHITEVVSGKAMGVDQLGERYAKENGITLKLFPANWKEHGKRAGYLRNVEMAEYADALIAVWDGVSNGTKHMIDIATSNNLKVYTYFTPL